jgi:hypothetical protein
MPEISRFFGIVIHLYYDDHAPPHFHAEYAGSEALIRIDDLSVHRGHLHPRALGLVMEWAALHQDELHKAWNDAKSRIKPSKIAPL